MNRDEEYLMRQRICETREKAFYAVPLTFAKLPGPSGLDGLCANVKLSYY